MTDLELNEYLLSHKKTRVAKLAIDLKIDKNKIYHFRKNLGIANKSTTNLKNEVEDLLKLYPETTDEEISIKTNCKIEYVKKIRGILNKKLIVDESLFNINNYQNWII
jgi:hypothetical protein